MTSIENVLSIRKNAPANARVALDEFEATPNAASWPDCRFESLEVVPGKLPVQCIREVFQELLFHAQVYQADTPVTISGKLEEVDVISIGAGHWALTLSIKSNISEGYTVSARYNFDAAWRHDLACRVAAAAFAPAVEKLFEQVVNHPGFSGLFTGSRTG